MKRPPPLDPENLMQCDRDWLARQWRRLAGMDPGDKRRERLREAFDQRLAASRARVQSRRERLPRLNYDSELPINGHREEIVAAIRAHPVVVIAGETGSGKSTQIPKFCLEAGRGVRGLIGVTQPRRIAARSVARRVAEELGTELGGDVGFQVRFTDRVSRDSYVKFMTDGILLAEIHGDRELDAYDMLIIDEAHERSLNIDFLLGYLKRLLEQRRDLKVIITSATIDTEKLSRHFNGAPAIRVEGRGHPVEVRYQPPADGEDLTRAIRRAIDSLARIDPRGDVLIFLPGEREIFAASRFLKKSNLPNTEVLPLYARLPAARQDRIFAPGAGRRIILATNVAETSLTVPGIRFVIDSGLARISRYATHSRVLRLPVEPVSKASCDQRAGRCGRIGPGTCVRLFDQADFESRPDYTEPEIQRAGLVGVVLEMLALGLGDPEDFPFVDRPAPRYLAEARNTLFELGALDAGQRLTATGRQLARLPVDARHGRMLIEAAQRGVLNDALVLVAALGIQDPRERPTDHQQAADQAHAEFADPASDFASLLKLWRAWQKERRARSRNQADQWARKHFLSTVRLHEWGQLVAQLKRVATDEKWRTTRGKAGDEAIHRSLLAGLLGHVGRHHEAGEYIGARGHKFRIFPGSVLAKRTPGWIMAAELVETARPYARTVAPVKPEWLEAQAAHLLRRRLFDPHWDRKTGRVMGFEQVSLHGLVLVEKRQMHFGARDPEAARGVFIRHALVRGEMNASPDFLKRNAALKRELAVDEAKRRRRDVLVGEPKLEAFFHERLPEGICTVKQFERWYDGLDDKQRQCLLYDRATLLREDAETAGAEFPDRLVLSNEAGAEHFRLRYRFEPGAPDDGVTLVCPLHLLNRLDPDRLDWLVPGLVEEKIAALIASLPKSIRRAFVPQREYVRAAREALGEPENGLRRRLAGELARIGGLDINPSDFKPEKLPPNLIMNVRVTGAGGKVLAEGRDVAALQARLGETARREFMDRQAGKWQRDGLRAWDCGDLPQEITTRGGHRAWPALIDQENAAGLRLFDDHAEARLAHRQGLLRLLEIALVDKFKYLARQHRLSPPAALAWTRMGEVAQLEAGLRRQVLSGLVDDAWTVRDAEAFQALKREVRAGLVAACAKAMEILDQTIQRFHETARRVETVRQAQPSAWQDMSAQLEDLIYNGFIDDITIKRLGHYRRYFDGIDQRIDALEIDPRRDVARQAEIDPWWQRYTDHLAATGTYTPELDRYRWLVEEYRVQVFAQQLGTAEKVSRKRLEGAWVAVEES